MWSSLINFSSFNNIFLFIKLEHKILPKEKEFDATYELFTDWLVLYIV